MKKLLLGCGVLSLFGGLQAAQAATSTYNVVTTWYEPDTQPKNSIFSGSFTFDDATHTVTNLQGNLTESMTGVFPMPISDPSAPYYDMTQVPLTYQLVTWHDDALAGTFAATFAKNTTNTFMGHTWTPTDGIDTGGVFDGGPSMKNYAASIQNSYALIFVPDGLSAANTTSNPLSLAWSEASGTGSAGLSYTAYADCAPGGMMGATCMTATSLYSYGATGTMSGYPLSQTIAVAVPEPETYLTLMVGLGLMGVVSRRRLHA